MRTASCFAAGLLLSLLAGFLPAVRGADGQEKGPPPTTMPTQEPRQDSLTAKQILERVADTYATCKSYRDTGLVKTLFHQSRSEADG